MVESMTDTKDEAYSSFAGESSSGMVPGRAAPASG